MTASAQRLPAEERREQILESAIRLFEEHPHTDVSTAEIAASAGVARALVHHYFGTRQQLYLEVLRRLYFNPPAAPALPTDAPLRERIGHLLDHWIRAMVRHRNTWLRFTAGGGPGSDPEVASILRDADLLHAQGLVRALEVEDVDEERLVPLVIAWSGLAKTAVRQWLGDGTLTETELRRLLVATLLTVVDEARDRP